MSKKWRKKMFGNKHQIRLDSSVGRAGD